MNPRDDAEKMKNTNYQCVRLQLELDYCWVAGALLYKMGQEDTRTMELYYNYCSSKDYCFGTFKNPEVLVTTSVLPEYIKITGEVLDIPLLYENSEKLYLTNLREKYEGLQRFREPSFVRLFTYLNLKVW